MKRRRRYIRDEQMMELRAARTAGRREAFEEVFDEWRTGDVSTFGERLRALAAAAKEQG